MATKEDAIIAIAKTLESVSKMVVKVIGNQNSSRKEIDQKQIELVEYQCQKSNELLAEIWEDLKKKES
jgi:hypothetical protein